MRLAYQMIGRIALSAVACWLAGCVASNPQPVKIRQYKGYIVSSVSDHAPLFEFFPIGKFEAWNIVGTESCVQELHSYLSKQHQTRDNDSDTGFSAWAYAELEGERLNIGYKDQMGHEIYQIRVQRVVELHPGTPGFMVPNSLPSPHH